MSHTTNVDQSKTSIVQSSQSRPLVALSDQQLLALCNQYGTQAKLWKQKFLGLLPEVERRKLFQQQGFSSVFEFAAKVGGVSREQVLRVLQLNKRFEHTPSLKDALVSGTVTVHKLARVASIATPENQEFLLHQSRLLSKSGLETLVKDIQAESKTVPGHSQKSNKIDKIEQFDAVGLSESVKQRLLVLRNRGLDINQLLEELLDEREQKIQEEKEKIAQEVLGKSRYIPKKVKNILKKEFGTKCAHETCTNKAQTIHHTRRYSLNPSHNPLFLAPLCVQHHEIAHAVDVKVRQYRRKQNL